MTTNKQELKFHKWARTDRFFFSLHSIISTILAIGIEHVFRFILLRCLLVLFYDERGQLLCRLDSHFVARASSIFNSIFNGFIHFNFILRMSLKHCRANLYVRNHSMRKKTRRGRKKNIYFSTPRFLLR